MSTAKLTISAAQAAKIGQLTYHKKPVSNILYDARSGVNLYQTGVGETIDVPDSVNITQLKALQSLGLFTVKEGTILPKLAAFSSVSYVAETGVLTLTFSAAVTSSILTSTVDGEATDDVIIEIAGENIAASFAAVSASTTITATIATGYDTDISVTINQTGASKILDASSSSVLPTTKTLDIISATDTVTSETYTVTNVDATTGTISEVPTGTDKATFLAALVMGEEAQTWDSSSIQTAEVFSDDTLIVTAEDGTTVRTYTIIVGSLIATVSSATYTVEETGATGTISNVPPSTAKATFLAALVKDNADEVWTDSGVADPVVDTNTLVSESEARLGGGTEQVETVTVTAGVVDAVLQSESITCTAGESTGAGNITMTVTANGMGSSPKPVVVPVATSDGVNEVGLALRTALEADTDVSAFFTVSGADATAILTAKTAAADDATMAFGFVDTDTTGVTFGVSTEVAAGVADLSGDITLTVTAANMNASPKDVVVAITEGSSTTDLATAYRLALSTDADVSGFFDVSGADADVVLTAKRAAANDATMEIVFVDTDGTGATCSASADTTPGVIKDAVTTVTYTIDVLNTVATVSSATYTVAESDGSNGTIIAVLDETDKATFLAALTKDDAAQTWVDTGISDPVISTDTLVVTAEDGATVMTYVITVDPSHIATVSSGTYTVAESDANNGTITGVAPTTDKATFLAALTKDDAAQVWTDTDIQDPVIDADTLVVTAEDTTTIITYVITVA